MRRARARAQDLPALLAAGTHSIGLFHTAGKGTRLAPLPAAENNNKPGVKLPVSTKMSDGSATPLSILESVIKQTGAYASSRKGRLSVFWGDQVFIPSVEVAYVPSCHVDILCTLGPMADEASWAEKGLQNYGLIAVGSSGSAAQVDKVTFAQATKMLSGLGDIESVGVSLGSFSLSNTILVSAVMCHHGLELCFGMADGLTHVVGWWYLITQEAFMTEFKSELEAKVGKLDTDPHLWMPLTLRCEDYCELMSSKGVPAETSEAHHARMAAFMERFAPAGESKRLVVQSPWSQFTSEFWCRRPAGWQRAVRRGQHRHRRVLVGLRPAAVVPEEQPDAGRR
jgi:hypothetical protein